MLKKSRTCLRSAQLQGTVPYPDLNLNAPHNVGLLGLAGFRSSAAMVFMVKGTTRAIFGKAKGFNKLPIGHHLAKLAGDYTARLNLHDATVSRIPSMGRWLLSRFSPSSAQSTRHADTFWRNLALYHNVKIF
jgi:hypothetical protein